MIEMRARIAEPDSALKGIPATIAEPEVGGTVSARTVAACLNGLLPFVESTAVPHDLKFSAVL